MDISLAVLLTLSISVFGSCSLAVISFAPRAVLIDDVSELCSEFDYVVIGGRMSGPVVADRLTGNLQSRCLALL